MSSKITNHLSQAIDRIAEQYKDSPKFVSLITSIANQTQEIEDVFFTLYDGRWVDTAIGQTLDDFGTIVGQERLGYDDDFYRILLYVKIVQNYSEGETETIINAYKLITQATSVYLEEYYPSGVYLMSDGQINLNVQKFVFEKLQEIVSAGVRIDFIGLFDTVSPFGFEQDPSANGFDDGTNLVSAGIFAETLETALDFGFDGTNNSSGFGTSDDSRLGGKFISV